jgi:hypothetical protein
MKTVRLIIIVAAVSLVPATSGCISTQTEDVGMTLESTSDLSTCAMQTRYITNLYPRDAKTDEMEIFSKSWTEGGTGITLSCLSRDRVGSQRIDGKVMLDGVEMQLNRHGFYSSAFKGSHAEPKTISIVTSSGQKADIPVQAPQALSLVSVNGVSKAARVDLSQDLALEFADFAPYSFARVALIAEGSEGRKFTEIGVFKMDRKLKIPAVAFEHHSLGNSAKILEGANYVLVEQFEIMPGTVPSVGTAQNLALGWAWMPVTVSGKTSALAGIDITGSLSTRAGDLSYAVSKPNASQGKPLSQASKFAVASLSIRGRLQNNEDRFPQVPIAWWDNELKKFHDALGKMFKSEFGITLVAPDKVLTSSIYNELDAAPDVYTKDTIQRSLRGLRTLSSSRLTSSTFPADKPDIQLMRDLGVDGLMDIEIEVDLITRAGKKALATSLTFRIIGEPSAYTVPTLYSQGTVSNATGIPFTGSEFKSSQSLDRVLRKSDLLAGLKQALREQEAKARDLGYEALWSLHSTGNRDETLDQDYETLPIYASGRKGREKSQQ